MFKDYIPSKNIALFKTWRRNKIAAMVRKGMVPRGVSVEEIWAALRDTRPNSMELFGFLSAKVYRADGTVQDLGLQSVRSITTAFTKKLVDGFANSTDAADLSNYKFHGMGAGSTAEATSQTALVAESGIKVAGSQTHGANSEIYRSIITIAATTAFGCREHGIFNTLTGGTMLDRSVVTNITLNTGDEVAWTYDLTCNSGG